MRSACFSPAPRAPWSRVSRDAAFLAATIVLGARRLLFACLFNTLFDVLLQSPKPFYDLNILRNVNNFDIIRLILIIITYTFFVLARISNIDKVLILLASSFLAEVRFMALLTSHLRLARSSLRSGT